MPKAKKGPKVLTCTLMLEFRNAVKAKDVARINKIVTDKNVRMVDKRGDTFLHLVAENGTVEMAVRLMELGARLGPRNENQRTPLSFATGNSLEMVKALLNDQTVIDSNLLRHALFHGTEEIVRLLLRHARVNSEFPENSSHDASEASGSQIKKPKILDGLDKTENLIKVFLHDKKYSLNKKTNYALLIFFAAKVNNKRVLELISNDCREFLSMSQKKSKTKTKKSTNFLEVLDFGGSKRETALHYAASQQSVDAVRFLLDEGANPNSANTSSCTPLHYAARLENHEICQLLLDAGANVNPNVDNVNPLHLVCGHNMLGKWFQNVDQLTSSAFIHFKDTRIFNLPIMKLLLTHGADPNGRGYDKIEPLLHACKSMQLEEVKLLLEFGAKIRVVDDYGKSCIHNAIARHSSEIANLVLKKGFEVDINHNSTHKPLAFLNGIRHIFSCPGVVRRTSP